MPKALHDKLAKRATELGLTGAHRDRYIYGTMAAIEQRKKKRGK